MPKRLRAAPRGVGPAALRLMTAMPPPGRCASFEALMVSADLDGTRTSATLRRLVRNGLARPVADDGYALTPAGVAARLAATEPPNGMRKAPANSLRQRLWRALRMAGKASLAELLVLASAGGESNPEKNAGTYLRALARAGYLARMPRRGNGRVRWLLLPDRNSGPRAPVWRAGKAAVSDPNNGKIYEVRHG